MESLEKYSGESLQGDKIAIDIGLLSSAEATDYYNNLSAQGMVPEYPPGSDMELRYLGPIEIPRETAIGLVTASNDMWKTVRQMIFNEGGVTKWLSSHPATILHESMNNPAINAQLEQRLSRGWVPPLVYDVLLTSTGPKIMEIQSCWAYSEWMHIVSDARGDYKRGQSCLFNGDPAELIKELRQLSGGQDITVVDMDPCDGVTAADKIAMARLLGDETSLPISPLEIERDDNGYYYWHLVTKTKVYIRNVLCRMLQPDLDSLSEKLIHGSEDKKGIVLSFLSDAGINWVWHPGWSSIVCKATLPCLYTTDGNASYKQHLVSTCQAGEIVSRLGRYICKPVAGSGGEHQYEVIITDVEEPYVVPKSYILQEYINPETFSVPVPESIVVDGVMPGMIELRVMSPMHANDGPGSTYLYVRLVPRYGIGPDGTVYTPQTNTGPATVALASLSGTQRIMPKMEGAGYLTVGNITRELYRQLPFGQGPAIIV